MSAPQVLDTAKSAAAIPAIELVKEAARVTGRPPQQLIWEAGRLSMGAGKISVEDYIALRLFDPALDDEARKTFAGKSAGKAIARNLNYNEHWLAVCGHKLVAETVIRGFGFPIARTRAIYAPGCRYPAFETLTSGDDIAAYVTRRAAMPAFGKPISSSLSLGTIGILSADAAAGTLALSNGRTLEAKTLAADIVANFADGYLFQDMLQPAAGLAAIGVTHVATARFYTLNTGTGAKVFRAALKLPIGANMADNYWRDGNVLAAVDYDTGRILRASSGHGPAQVEVERHPVSGAPIVGFELPHWREAAATVTAAADTLGELPFIGWDVALTDTGPVIVELNDSPDISLPQMAERRGVMDEQLSAALRWSEGVRRSMSAADAAQARSHGGLRNAVARILGRR